MANKWNLAGVSVDTSNNMTTSGNLTVAGAITATGGVVGDINGDITATTLAAEHGLGALGTGTPTVPQTTRREENGTIITEIAVDITGYTVTGTAQGGAIGKASTDGCYIGRYVGATYGVVNKVEMICLVTPTEDTATFEQDIDLCYTTAADVQAGEDVDVDIIAAGRDWAAGETVQTILPGALTEGDYFYLAAGDTAGDTGTYGAGQFIIRFYGHAALA